MRCDSAGLRTVSERRRRRGHLERRAAGSAGRRALGCQVQRLPPPPRRRVAKVHVPHHLDARACEDFAGVTQRAVHMQRNLSCSLAPPWLACPKPAKQMRPNDAHAAA